MVRCALQRFRNYSAVCVKNNDLARAAAKVAAGTSFAFTGYQFVYKQLIRRSMTVHAALKSVATEVALEPAARRQTYITIRGLSKQFDRNALYQGFDLDIPQGRFTSIFGPNGCGKSTLINMIAGLTPIDSGEILFDGKTLRETTIGYVFQNYRDALFPWKRALDNIKYPLEIAGKSKAECNRRVQELIASFDIRFDLERYPYELSGGQQQLVSIMRALAPHPEVLFLDEPFSALDYEMTLFIRDKLQEFFKATGVTMILVSHDLEEAVYLADRILLLTKRPTRVAETVPFNAPRMRDSHTLSSEEFIRIKAQCLEIFQREVRR
jgi:NitT/TauT family transport system ATP-binding protein